MSQVQVDSVTIPKQNCPPPMSQMAGRLGREEGGKLDSTVLSPVRLIVSSCFVFRIKAHFSQTRTASPIDKTFSCGLTRQENE
jgi:hypothetical protein